MNHNARDRVITAVLFCLITAWAQDRVPQCFDVASVKVSSPSTHPEWRVGPGAASPTKVTIRRSTALGLIQAAFALKLYQLSGPRWVTEPYSVSDTRYYDIDAVVPPGVSKAQALAMLQCVLVERFHLKYHWEKRPGTVCELTVSLKGHKMKRVDDRAAVDAAVAASDRARSSATSAAYRDGLTVSTESSTSMDELATWVSNVLRLPVENKTGLAGRYAFVLSYRRDLGPAPSGGATDKISDSGPSIAEALQPQLGLKLQRRKAMVDVFVIDKLDQSPTPN